MPWKKAPATLVEAFDRSLPKDERVERRQMFGYPCAFVNGNMFAGTHEHRLLMRLPEGHRDALLALPGAERFEPMPGRVMREYAVAPPAMLEDRSELSRWLRRSLDYAASLPPKKRRAAGAKKKPRAAATRTK